MIRTAKAEENEELSNLAVRSKIERLKQAERSLHSWIFPRTV